MRVCWCACESDGIVPLLNWTLNLSDEFNSTRLDDAVKAMMAVLPFHDEATFRKQLREYWRENLGPTAHNRTCKRAATHSTKATQLLSCTQVPTDAAADDDMPVSNTSQSDDDGIINEASVALAAAAANNLNADHTLNYGVAAMQAVIAETVSTGGSPPTGDVNDFNCQLSEKVNENVDDVKNDLFGKTDHGSSKDLSPLQTMLSDTAVKDNGTQHVCTAR